MRVLLKRKIELSLSEAASDCLSTVARLCNVYTDAQAEADGRELVALYKRGCHCCRRLTSANNGPITAGTPRRPRLTPLASRASMRAAPPPSARAAAATGI